MSDIISRDIQREDLYINYQGQVLKMRIAKVRFWTNHSSNECDRFNVKLKIDNNDAKNKNTHIFEDRVKIETENTFVQLIFNRDTNEWEIDHKLIPKNSEYKFKLYQTDFGSYMFYLNSDSKISNLMVNSDNIQQKI